MSRLEKIFFRDKTIFRGKNCIWIDATTIADIFFCPKLRLCWFKKKLYFFDFQFLYLKFFSYGKKYLNLDGSGGELNTLVNSYIYFKLLLLFTNVTKYS